MQWQHSSSKLFTFSFFVVLSILSQSCTSTKVVGRNNLYQYERNTGGLAKGKKFSTSEKLKVKKIEEVGNMLQVTFTDEPALDEEKTFSLTNEDITARGITATKKKVYYYLTESEDDVNFSTKNGKLRKHFAYTTLNYGIQPLAVPIKFRSSQSSKTDLAANVETSFNLGIAFGMKNTLNIYKLKSNLLNKKLTQYSIMPGIGFGFGSADLDPTLNAPGIRSKRKLATFSPAGFIMVGLNNINFGYAVGFDRALGSGGGSWTYNKRLWQGLIVSLDAIKF